LLEFDISSNIQHDNRAVIQHRIAVEFRIESQHACLVEVTIEADQEKNRNHLTYIAHINSAVDRHLHMSGPFTRNTLRKLICYIPGILGENSLTP